ncbi:conserved hypothetical protein [Vibrio phage 120E34-1]|nr:conserved hypothetical protein [Vibrio phage 120E34-1]
MAIYFIKSKTPLATQDGSVDLDSPITSHDAYNEMIENWKVEVSSKAGCGVDNVEILVVSKLS